VWRVTQPIRVSTCTAWKIWLDDLSLFPYETQLTQPLSEDRIQRYYAFVKEKGALLEDSQAILNVTWWSDGAHFHLDGYINKQNVGIWSSENSRHTVGNTQNPERATIWCAILLFTSSLLSDEFVSFLIWYGVSMNSAWFQQPCTTLLISNAIFIIALFIMYSKKESYQTGILRYLRKDFHGHHLHRTYTLAIVFCGDTWRIDSAWRRVRILSRV
jgi:hypothetical protein